MPTKPRILFLCVHNSARSILAEFLVNAYRGDHCAAFSAGLEPGRVNPNTLRVLEEAGIDPAGARSKSVETLRGQEFDLVVSVCDPSEGSCPVWLGAGRQAHFTFPDPTAGTVDDGEQLQRLRSIRDRMTRRLLPWLDEQLSEIAASMRPVSHPPTAS